MAKITANISLTSADLTSDALSINKSASLVATAAATFDQTSGLTRLNNIDTGTGTVIHDTSGIVNSEGFLYVFNTDSTINNTISIKIDTVVIGSLPGGHFALLPFDPNSNQVNLIAVSSSTTVEYQIFHRG